MVIIIFGFRLRLMVRLIIVTSVALKEVIIVGIWVLVLGILLFGVERLVVVGMRGIMVVSEVIL
jgi:hypothetical protein